MSLVALVFFFFFQAEDGIRDDLVTGVQTCALPIYSWGASVVIAGALFKLTHIDGADIMLWLGMGTEVIVFFLAGFEPQESMDAQELAEEAVEKEEITKKVKASISKDSAFDNTGGTVFVNDGGGNVGGSVDA